MKIEIFKQGADNWGYVLSNNRGEAIAVDPLDDDIYTNLLHEKKLNLVGILATHYHADHIEGIPPLLKKHKVPVVGPDTAEAPPFITTKVSDGTFSLGSFSFQSRFLPGHSKSHCVYREAKKNWLFVGDLLFHLGCGRVLDSEPQTLFHSLQELKDYPPASEIFVGHDYREKNHRFCSELDPRIYSALHLSDLDKSTTLEMELWWNPFLKTSSFDEWWELRQRRNNF